MAQTVGTHGVAVFTSPSNGDTLDATVVKGNDNNLRSAYVDHDADGGLHVQSSSFATRSSPGSLGRKWLTTDTNSYRLFFDDGSAWYEVSYLSSNGGTVTGDVTVTGTLTASVTGSVTGNASTATALQTARNINGVAFNGTADITVTAAAGTLSGSTLNSGVTASSLTSVGTLSTLQVSGNAAFDTNTLFVDAANNAVGIGTTTPVASYLSKFAVEGNIAAAFGGKLYQFDATNSTGRYIQALSNSEFSIGKYQAGGDIEQVRITGSGNLAVDTNTLFVDATNNRVGVGTAAPDSRLHISQPSTVNWKLENTEVGGATVASYAGTGVGSFGTISNHPVFFYTNNVERARIDSAGNLGVGTTTPAAKLHVSDTANATILRLSGSSGSGLLQQFKMQSASGKYNWFIGAQYAVNNGFEIAASTVVDGDTPAAPMFRLTSDGNLGLDVTPSAWGAGTKAIQVRAGTALYNPGSAVQSWLMTNSYNNGTNFIYTNTGAAGYYAQNGGIHAWHSAPSGTAGAAISFTQAMTLDASGNLLVGATAALTSRNEFRLAGNANGSIIAMGRGGANKLYIGVDSSEQVDIQNQANTPMVFYTNNTERVRVKAEGQFRYVPLSAAPTTSVENGDVYYDSTTNKLRVRAAGAWVDLH